MKVKSLGWLEGGLESLKYKRLLKDELESQRGEKINQRIGDVQRLIAYQKKDRNASQTKKIIILLYIVDIWYRNKEINKCLKINIQKLVCLFVISFLVFTIYILDFFCIKDNILSSHKFLMIFWSN